jgi:NAD(P)-dependent dehydrogenase (short-subunit alcohol dehydrogenase family)
MKVIIVGASGTLGKRLVERLSPKHDIIKASKNGDVKVDITSRVSIENMYREVGKFDALINVAGSGYMGSFETTTEENFYQGIRSKMMGQINLVMVGKDYISDNGSFTLTSGILTHDPIPNGTVLSVINHGVNGFVIGASPELKRGVRLNVVSPGLVEDSYEALGKFFPGHTPVEMKKVVNAYVKSLEGIIRGQIIEVFS